jgi:hypothetical protein
MIKSLSVWGCAMTLGSVVGAASAQDAAPLFPQQISASELKFFCASSSLTGKGRLRRRYCEGFISGVEEGLRISQLQNASAAPALMCVPNGTSSRQMSEVFIRYASRKGVVLEQPAAAVVIEALRDAYACPTRELSGSESAPLSGPQ